MGAEVFISYARRASAVDAAHLYEELGDAAFLDTDEIDDLDVFPEHLFDALVGARVAVVFASSVYFRRWYCLLEYRLAVSPGWFVGDRHSDEEAFDAYRHVVVALPPGLDDATLGHLPPRLRLVSWPGAGDTAALAGSVRARLAEQPPPIGLMLDEIVGLDRLRAAVVSAVRTPQPRAFPAGHFFYSSSGLQLSAQEGFVGRGDDLWALSEALAFEPGELPPVVAVEGPSGVGKTRLAVEYMRRIAPERSPGGCIWIDAGLPVEEQWSEVLASLSGTAEPTVGAAAGVDVAAALHNALASHDESFQPLVVVDNVPQSTGDGSSSSDAWAPVAGRLPVLLTSQSQLGWTTEDVRSLTIGPLDLDDAIGLLARGLPPSMLGRDAAVRLVAWVGCLPLALRLLNAALASRALSVDALLALAIGPSQTEVLDSLADDLTAATGRTLRGPTVAFGAVVQSLSSEGRTLAARLAFLADTPLPEDLVDELAEPGTARRARAELIVRCVLSGSPDPAFVGSMHGLLAGVVRSSVSVAGDLQHSAQALIARLEPDRVNDQRQWRRIAALEPHSHALMSHLAALQAWDAFETFGLALTALYMRQSRYDAAASTAVYALSASQPHDVRGLTPVRGQLVFLLPQALAGSGNLDTAIDLQRINVQHLVASGADDDAVRTARDNLAEFLRTRDAHGRAEALPMLQEARAYWQSRDPRSPATAAVTNNLALLLVDEGRHSEAVPLFEEVLAIADRDPLLQIERVQTRLNLAAAVQPADSTRARDILERALEQAANLDIPDEHESVRAVLDRLADAASAAGEHGIAAGYLARLHRALEQVELHGAARLTTVARRLSEATRAAAESPGI